MSPYHSKQLSVEELIKTGYTFEIPLYQRGYRWGKTEVVDLLEDINELEIPSSYSDILTNQENVERYCLQPLVFDASSKDNQLMTVVDGQQRLTTLFLILTFIRKLIQKDTNSLKKFLFDNGIDEEAIEPILNLFDSTYVLQFEGEKRQRIFENVSQSIEEINMDDIDAYYMSSAYSYIYKWGIKQKLLSETLGVAAGAFFKFAIKVFKCLSVIWYDLDESTDGTASEYFSKINSGKIALTNSELIKANLMLDEYCVAKKEDLFSDIKDELLRAQKKESQRKIRIEKLMYERIKMSRQWDEIEWQLRSEEFWLFISDKSDKYNDTRIDFLFDILAKKYYDSVKETDLEYEQFVSLNKERATFIIFARYLKNKQKENPDEAISLAVWKEIWSIYMTFKEWFNNRKLYHYIGYVISADANTSAAEVYDLVSQENCSSKRDVEILLLNRIKKLCLFDPTTVFEKEDSEDNIKKNKEIKEKYEKKIKSLDYNHDYHAIRKVLLLFNVISVLNDKSESAIVSRDTFFPFGRSKSEKWNLEHIHSLADGVYPQKVAEKYVEYLKKLIKLMNDKQSKDYKALEDGYELFERVEQEKRASGEKDAYVSAVRECAIAIDECFRGDLDADLIGKIGNMALLDEKTNKSYHNVPFFMKRLVISDVVNGRIPGVSRFIPSCTRSVFDKSYSKILGNTLHWTTEDCNDYAEQIVSTIIEFFKKESENV